MHAYIYIYIYACIYDIEVSNSHSGDQHTYKPIQSVIKGTSIYRPLKIQIVILKTSIHVNQNCRQLLSGSIYKYDTEGSNTHSEDQYSFEPKLQTVI